MKNQIERVELRPARTGRPSTRTRTYAPDELVRLETRIPARLARQLYDVAHEADLPVSVVHADLLAKALSLPGGSAMT